MTSFDSTEVAMGDIRGLVEMHGTQVRANELCGHGDETLVGRGIYDVEDVSVDLQGGLVERLVQDHNLVGKFACRAVIVDPAQSRLFTGDGPDVEGLTVVQASFNYYQAPSDLTKGGPTRQTATYALGPQDGIKIDEYYYATYRRRTADHPELEPMPERPHISVEYWRHSPYIPRVEYDTSGATTTQLAFDRIDAEEHLQQRLQDTYPETKILSGIMRQELPLLASWLIHKATQTTAQS